MNCDGIAPFYESLEKAAFGKALQKHRVAFLQAVEQKQRALILGDGDGRFTQALMSAYPHLAFDSLEISAGMVAEAKKRNVTMTQGDAMIYPFRKGAYDIVFTHFFLDCFSIDQVNALIGGVAEALTNDAIWVVSDFKQVSRGWRKLYTRVWLATMYFFFRIATGLQAQRLSDYEPALKSAGFTKRREYLSRHGLIASEWWQR